MKNALHSVIVAFSELFKWDTMRIILLSGGLVTLLWIGLGYLFWDPLMMISQKIIDLIPFSMIRSNGAWFLSFFLWFQMVLVTFGLFYAFFGNLIMTKFPKEKFTKISFMTIFMSAVFWAFIWLLLHDQIHQFFNQMLLTFPFETIQKLLATLVGIYIIYNGINVTMLFIASFFSAPIIKYIAKKHFDEEIKVGMKKWLVSIRYTIRDSLIYLILTLIAFPLLFIPILNIVVQIVLWIWLYKDTISFDAVTIVYTKPDRSIIKKHRFAVWFVSFVAVLFNFIPVFNIFGAFFGEIAMFHYFKSLKKSQQ
jgi:hypothetical protein